jgi:Outer membrane protein beta-barrel domain
MTRTARMFLFLVVAGLPLPNHAQERIPAFDSGWYLGGGISINDVYSYEDTCWGCYTDAEYGDNDTGLTLTAGYRATKYLAIEASYFSPSTLHWDKGVTYIDNTFQQYAVDAAVDLSALQVNALAIAAGRLWEGYLRVGLVYWDASSELRLTQLGTGNVLAADVDDSAADFTIGIGLGRSVGDSWQVRVDYAFYPLADGLLALGGSQHAYTDVLTLQMIKRFGRDRN